MISKGKEIYKVKINFLLKNSVRMAKEKSALPFLSYQNASL